jgi:tetratricopeptide (TPR) repeat protein
MRFTFLLLLLSLLLIPPVQSQSTDFLNLAAAEKELAALVPPAGDEEVRKIREQAIASFSAMAMSDARFKGIPERLLGARMALQVANVFLHRHHRYSDALAIAKAVESLYKSLGDSTSAAQATTLMRRMEILKERGKFDRQQVATDLDETPAPPAFLWPVLGGCAGLSILMVAYLLIFKKNENIGIHVADAQVQAEAERALKMGITMLKKGRSEQAIKYFQKVARLESTLRARGDYYLAVVSLEQDDMETVTRTMSTLDFAAIDMDEAYAMGDALEKKGRVEEAKQLFEKLYLTDVNFKDVNTRLNRLRKEAEQFSGNEVAEMIAQRVLDPRFRGVRLIGTGGMGFVYEANDSQRDGIKVALKVLSPFYANNEEAYTRFIREASGISKLEHPNLVKIFDVFKVNLPYYTMEFLSDRDLKDLIQERHRVSPSETIRIAKGICRGLGFAHQHGITHRDMKPANVLILDDGSVKVIDFGIAKFEEEEQMTVTGQVMGTPLYMSPEQIKGMETDHRSDIYSVGIILYEMLTGFPPFETMMERALKPAPPFPKDLNLPPTLEAAVMGCLSRHVEDRLQSLEEFVDQLGKSL